MATSTYMTFLMLKGTDSTYAKLCDITEFPDIEPTPEMIDVTTLSDGIRTYVPGIGGSSDGAQFKANYDMATYSTLKSHEGTQKDYALWIGGTESGGVATPTGSNGKWNFPGKLTVTKDGGGVNEAQTMTITIAMAAKPEFVTGATGATA